MTHSYLITEIFEGPDFTLSIHVECNIFVGLAESFNKDDEVSTSEGCTTES